MTRKTADCYASVFKFVEENIFKLEPLEIMTDFEDGMRKGIKIVYPNVVLRGCWFHFNQAINRKCVKLGMRKFLEFEPEAYNIVSQLRCLPLLPPNNFEEGYTIIRNSVAQKGLETRFHKLLRYFSSYWMNQV